MPTYVYACKEKEHPRREVIHGMKENPAVLCKKCGRQMHRVPQRPAAISFTTAIDLQLDWMDENYKRFRARKAGRKAPAFHPYKVTRPGKPLPLRGRRNRND